MRQPDERKVLSACLNDAALEIRRHTANDRRLDGVLEALGFISKLFERYGLENGGYWIPADSQSSKTMRLYPMRYADHQVVPKDPDNFRNRPEWLKGPEAFSKNIGRSAGAGAGVE